MSAEDKTLIPVISVSIGYGGGNSSGKLSQGSAAASQGSANTDMGLNVHQQVQQ
ncbi:MAG: spore germination protein GerW family protein [Thermotaleaceae bacterium]